MSLTDAQKITLGNDIRANTDPTVQAAVAAGDNNVIKDFYNGDHSPDYWIYRRSVPTEEIKGLINPNNLVNITATDKDRALALLELRADGSYDGSIADERLAWDDVFSAASGDESQQAIAAAWTRLATYAEEVFKLSTGTGANAANADTTSWQGVLSLQDVRDAMSLTAP